LFVYILHNVRQAAELAGKKLKVCTVIGLTGKYQQCVKLYEAQDAVENGAMELDVVINLGLVKS